MNQVKDFFEYVFNAFKIWVIIQPFETALIIRNGKNIREVYGGIYFKLPYFDSVYVQEKRLRVASMSMQTVTTKDLKTITINCCIGYSIVSIKRLYETLYYPETTITNIAASEIAECIFNFNSNELTPKIIEEIVFNKIKINDFGLKFEYFRILNFAAARTYRLIQDQSWVSEGLYMSDKKK